jgi:hypothetical protein
MRYALFERSAEEIENKRVAEAELKAATWDVRWLELIGPTAGESWSRRILRTARAEEKSRARFPHVILSLRARDSECCFFLTPPYSTIGNARQ